MAGVTIWRSLFACALVAVALTASPARATYRWGSIQISGNLESQQLLRVDQGNGQDFQAFNLVQQRNTLRLQYEQDLVKRGLLFDTVPLFIFDKMSFFAYYRLVYESVYHIAPGPRLKANDGSRAGSLDETHLDNGDTVQIFSNRARNALALENVLREVFLDFGLKHLPISFRIGRQQIVWGNTVNFRALDNTNALDLDWHLQQEAGILGKVGFSELRIPSWTVKALVKLPSIGPFSNNYLEAYDIPFEFRPTDVTFLPRPWSLPIRNPFRSGLVVDAAPGGQTNVLLLQPCFDFTGSKQPNMEATPDFSRTAETGICNGTTTGLPVTNRRQGRYEAHDIEDVNQFGVRLGSTFTPISLGYTLNYKYQRHIVDATGGTVAKSFANFAAAQAGSNPLSFIEFTAPGIVTALGPGGQGHETCDQLTGRCSTVDGYIRLPTEFYYPYVSIFGLSLDYFEEFTSAVYNLEFAATKGVPIANLNPDPNFPGLRRTWEYEAALLIDRPTWIRFLNRRSTFTTLIQGNLSMVPDRDEVRCTGTPPFAECTGGDVGAPSSNAVPGLFRDEATLDQRRRFEYLTIVAMQTFYKGGSVSPLVAWVSDWNNIPAMAWIVTLQYLPTPNFIVEPTLRVFWTNGHTVDDRYSVSRNAGRSELQLKFTYQF